jgi:hypothetical protein
MNSTTPTLSADKPASLFPAGVRSFSAVADYRTAWHTVPAGRYLLLHVSGCERIAQQERFFGADPVYEFTGFVTEHTSNLAFYADYYHCSLPCACLPNSDYFVQLPDDTHWHLPRAFDTARYAVVMEVNGRWEPVAWCQREDQAEELARQQPDAQIAPVHREFPHPLRCG